MRTLYIRPHPGVSPHFWHFMMGEFLPVMYVIFKGKYETVHLLKSKAKVNFPLNAFYYEVCNDYNVQITISDKENTTQTYVEPLNWDWYFKGESAKLLWISAFLKHWALSTSNTRTNKPLCVVQERKNSQALDTYYKNYTGEHKRFKTYGALRRQVTNMQDVCKQLKHHLRAHYTVQCASNDAMTLQQQICQYSHAKIIVLGHGAGMVHVLWMQPRSCIIEIIPQAKSVEQNGAVQGCKRLSKLLHFKLYRVVVPSPHSPVSVKKVIRLIPRQHAKKNTLQNSRYPTTKKTFRALRPLKLSQRRRVRNQVTQTSLV